MLEVPRQQTDLIPVLLHASAGFYSVGLNGTSTTIRMFHRMFS